MGPILGVYLYEARVLWLGMNTVSVELGLPPEAIKECQRRWPAVHPPVLSCIVLLV